MSLPFFEFVYYIQITSQWKLRYIKPTNSTGNSNQQQKHPDNRIPSSQMMLSESLIDWYSYIMWFKMNLPPTEYFTHWGFKMNRAAIL